MSTPPRPEHHDVVDPAASAQGAPVVDASGGDAGVAGGAASAPRPASAPPPRRGHGGGNWRSLIISMAVIMLIVFAWLALMPRPGKAPYAAVDVSASARQVAQETSWPLQVPRLGAPWVPTSVRFGQSDTGQRTWHIGYNVEGDDSVYVGVEQTRQTDARGDQAWIESQVKQGAPQGEASVGGQRWERYVLGGQTPRESLVRRGADGMLVVVTGLGGQQRLAEVAASLQPYHASASSNATAPSGTPTG